MLTRLAFTTNFFKPKKGQRWVCTLFFLNSSTWAPLHRDNVNGGMWFLKNCPKSVPIPPFLVLIPARPRRRGFSRWRVVPSISDDWGEVQSWEWRRMFVSLPHTTHHLMILKRIPMNSPDRSIFFNIHYLTSYLGFQAESFPLEIFFSKR